jgi:hypothetical protein
MRAWFVPFLLLAALPANAQKPWEMRVDLPVTVPVELPAVPPTNPFAATLSSAPAPIASPLQPKFVISAPAQAAAYVDATGVCRRVVPIALPFQGIARQVQTALEATTFTPGKSFGTVAATWLPVGFEVQGRIEEGRMLSLQVLAPDPTNPPVQEVVPSPAADSRDLAMPAVTVDKLDVVPLPKRFKLRIDGWTWRQEVRLLAEVSPEGRVSRVVFLSCPDGLRTWLLRSLASWTFRPGQSAEGPVAAWVQVELAAQVEISDQASDGLRVSRQTGYPPAAGAPGGGPPPGA